MKNNTEKWNFYKSIIDIQTQTYINVITNDIKLPFTYYVVYDNGDVVERILNKWDYAHHKQGGILRLNKKIPSNKEVKSIKEYSEAMIFNSEFIFGWCTEKKFNKYPSTISYHNFINKVDLYYDKNEADGIANLKLKKKQDRKDFIDKYRAINYNYSVDGYRFLGWQNGWKNEALDEDGMLCLETGKKPHRSEYSRELYPEYHHCISLKHDLIDVSHNSRGTENTVCCPICKIYWKYDCSD